MSPIPRLSRVERGEIVTIEKAHRAQRRVLALLTIVPSLLFLCFLYDTRAHRSEVIWPMLLFMVMCVYYALDASRHTRKYAWVLRIHGPLQPLTTENLSRFERREILGVEGRVAGDDVSVRIEWRSTVRIYRAAFFTDVDTRPFLDTVFEIRLAHRLPLSGHLSPVTRSNSRATGDVSFEDRIDVVRGDPEQVRAFLTPARQEAILAFHETFPDFKIRADRVRAALPDSLPEPGQARAQLDSLLTLIKALR